MAPTIKTEKFKKICNKAPSLITHISNMDVTVFQPFLRGQQVKVKGRVPALSQISCMNFLSHLTYLTHGFFLGTIKQLDQMVWGLLPVLTFLDSES